MGAQQSNSAQVQKLWSSTEIRLLSTPGQPKLVQSVTVPSIFAERYVGQMLNKNQLEELAILRERRVPRQNIVNVYDYQIKKGLFGCARNVDCFDIVTERVPFRLSQFQNLGQKQMIYIFHDSLCGYRDIYRYGRLCLPTAQAIGIKQNGQVKVWTNQNWSDNAFRPAKTQAQSIQCLWNCIKLCGDYRSYWNFTQNLYKLIPINFQNTINLIRNLYPKQIKEGRQSIQQILNTFPKNLPYGTLFAQSPIITTIGMTLNIPQSVPTSIQVPTNKPQSVHIQIPHNESRQGQHIIYGNTTQMLKPKLVTQNQLMIRPRAYSQQVRKTNAYNLNSNHNNEPQLNIIQTKLANMQPSSNLFQQQNHGIVQSGLPTTSLAHHQCPPLVPTPINNPPTHVKPHSVFLNQATMQMPLTSTTITPINALHVSTINSKNYGNFGHVDHGMVPPIHNAKINTNYEGSIRNRTVTLPCSALGSQAPRNNIINMTSHQEPANLNLNLIRTNQSKYKQSQNQVQSKFLQIPQQQLLSISASSSKQKPKSTLPYHKISLSNHQNDNERRMGTTHENLYNQGQNFNANIGTGVSVVSHPQPKINIPISNYIPFTSQAQQNMVQYRQIQQRGANVEQKKQRKYSPNSINTGSNNAHINTVNFTQPMVNLNQSAVSPSYILNNMNKNSNPENTHISDNMTINSNKVNTNKISINFLSPTVTRPLTPILYERNTGIATNQSASNSYYSNNYNDPHIYSITVSSNQMVPNSNYSQNTVVNSNSTGVASKVNNSTTGTPSININMIQKPKSVSAPKTTTVPGLNNLNIDNTHTSTNEYGNINRNQKTNAKNLNKITIHHEMSINSNNSIVNSRRNSFNAKSSRQNRTITNQYQIKYQSRHKNDWHKNQVADSKLSYDRVGNIIKYSSNLNNNGTTNNSQNNSVNMVQLKNQKAEPLSNSFFNSSTTKTLHHHYEHMKNTQNASIFNGTNQHSSYKNSQFAPDNLLQTISNKTKINVTKNQATSNIPIGTTKVQQSKEVTSKTPALPIVNHNLKLAQPQKINYLNLNINLNNIRTHELNYNSNTQRPQYAQENPDGDYYLGSNDSNYQVAKEQRCNVVTDNITKGLKTQQNEQVPQNLPYQNYYKYNEHISQRQTMAIDQTAPAYYRQQDISISVTNDVTNPTHEEQDQVTNSINTDRTTNINSITDRYHIRGNSSSFNNEQATAHAELYQIFNNINNNYSSNSRHPHPESNNIKGNKEINIIFQSPIKGTRTQNVIENHDHLTKSKNWDDLRYEQNYKYYNNGEGLNNSKNLKKQQRQNIDQQEKIQFLNQNNQYLDYQQLAAKNRYQFNNQANPPQYQIVNKRPVPEINQKNDENTINSMKLDLQKQNHQNGVDFQSPGAKQKPIQNAIQPQGNKGQKQQENIYGYSADSDTRKVAQEFKYLLRSVQKSPRSSNQNSNNSSPNKNTDTQGLFDKDDQKDVHSYSSGNIVPKYRNPVTNFQQYQQYQKQMEYYQHRGYSKENQLEQQLQIQIEQRQRKNKQLLINTMAIPQRWDQQQSLSQNF